MMRLKYPSGEVLEDPSIDNILEALRNLDPADDDPFFIVEDLSFENAFMQTRRHSRRWYIVEYRDGVSGQQHRSGLLLQPLVEELFRSYIAGDESHRKAIAWENISEYLLKREMNDIQKAIATLTEAADSLKKYEDATPVPPEEGKLYRTFNDSIVCVISIDEADDGRVVVLRGGHGQKSSTGEKAGEIYEVDEEGYYKGAAPGVETVMSLRQMIDFDELNE